VSKVLKDHKVLRVVVVLLEQAVFKVLRVHKVCLVFKEILVQ
jgi:hypothetical protein